MGCTQESLIKYQQQQQLAPISTFSFLFQVILHKSLSLSFKSLLKRSKIFAMHTVQAMPFAEFPCKTYAKLANPLRGGFNLVKGETEAFWLLQHF